MRKLFDFRVIFGITIALYVTFAGLSIWNKVDCCSGRSRQFALQARQHRLEAAKPGVSATDKKAYLRAAAINDFAAAKYARIASRPWLPYPGYPAITPEEIASIDIRE